MTQQTQERLFGFWRAFDHPVTLWAVVGVAAALVVSAGVLGVLKARGKALWPRWSSWVWLVAVMLVPLLLGAAWVIAAVALLSLLAYREFARATGLFREKLISAVVVLGILALTFACYDNYSRLFFATGVLTVGLVSIVTIPFDQPKGYIQRTALGVMGFLLFGYCFAYLGMMANYPYYRPLLLTLLIGVEMNDVFAFCAGKLVGGPKLLPNTSPGKTVAGSVGALVCTTALVSALAYATFHDTALAAHPEAFLILGLGTSVLGQFGDLLLSSIKRDLGLKDIGAAIPGHGGLLDRFDSLVLVPPAAFHFLSLYLGPLNALGSAERIFTGGG